MDEMTIGDLYCLSALRTEGFEPIGAAQDGHRVAWVFRAAIGRDFRQTTPNSALTTPQSMIYCNCIDTLAE